MSRVTRPSAPRPSADAPAASTLGLGHRWPYGASSAQDEDEADAKDPSLHPVCVLSSAAQAGVQKPAGVAASVFDAGRLAKQAQPSAPKRVRCDPLDLASVVIDTDVGLISRVESRSAQLTATCLALLDRMQPGHSVLLPAKQGLALYRVAHRARRKVQRRVQPDGSWRVWRLADPQGAAGAAGQAGAAAPAGAGQRGQA